MVVSSKFANCKCTYGTKLDALEDSFGLKKVYDLFLQDF